MVEGALSAEVSLITLDMLEIIVQVYCHLLLHIHQLFSVFFLYFSIYCLVSSKWRRLIRGTEEDSDDSGG